MVFSPNSAFEPRPGPLGASVAALWLAFLLGAFGATCLGGCSGPEGSDPALRVLGAASLRDVLEDYGEAFRVQTGTRVEIVTGGSTLIANQLLAGAKADLFLSAGDQEADLLQAAGLLLAGSRRVVFRNGLVVIAPRSASAARPQAQTIQELFAGDERISIAHPEAVPAGRYAKAWLEQHNLWGQLKPRCVYALDVRAALAAVESGSLELGLVYRTDAATSNRVQVIYQVTPEDGPEVVYPGAILQATPTPALAESFLDFLARGNPTIASSHGFGAGGVAQ